MKSYKTIALMAFLAFTGNAVKGIHIRMAEKALRDLRQRRNVSNERVRQRMTQLRFEKAFSSTSTVMNDKQFIAFLSKLIPNFKGTLVIQG